MKPVCRAAFLVTSLIVTSYASSAAERYDPAWAGIAPQRTITHVVGDGMTTQQAGAELVRAVEALKPGDRLERV